MKNTSELVSSKVTESILVEYMDELARSRYNYSFRLNVLSLALLSYEKVLKLALENPSPIESFMFVPYLHKIGWLGDLGHKKFFDLRANFFLVHAYFVDLSQFLWKLQQHGFLLLSLHFICSQSFSVCRNKAWFTHIFCQFYVDLRLILEQIFHFSLEVTSKQNILRRYAQEQCLIIEKQALQHLLG